MHGAVGGLSGKGLLMQRAVAVAVEETADSFSSSWMRLNGGPRTAARPCPDPATFCRH